jgi:hypothetical protein
MFKPVIVINFLTIKAILYMRISKSQFLSEEANIEKIINFLYQSAVHHRLYCHVVNNACC